MNVRAAIAANPRAGYVVAAAVAALATPVVLHFEGEIRRGYRDPIGIVTACVGHTETAQMGRTYTAEECSALLKKDLAEHDAKLMACVKHELPPNVHAAMLSFTFNVGANAACSSTMMRKLNEGDFMGACAELSRWVYAGGKQLPGLVKRRAAERRLCENRPPSLGVMG